MTRRPYTPLPQKVRAFIDTETTGLVPGEEGGEIIEIAIVREYPGGISDRWSTKVRPQHIETADPKAIEVNGYTPEAWADAPTWEEVAEQVKHRLTDCICVGHNVSFDLDFIEAEMRRVGIKIRFYHRIDTVTLAMEHLVPCGLTSVSFDNIRRFLGWPLEGRHSALLDALDAQRLYHLLDRAGHRKRLLWRLRHLFSQATPRRR